MGEHRDDLSYEELVRRREMKEREEEEEEEREIRKEAEQLAKQETSHILALASECAECMLSHSHHGWCGAHLCTSVSLMVDTCLPLTVSSLQAGLGRCALALPPPLQSSPRDCQWMMERV